MILKGGELIQTLSQRTAGTVEQSVTLGTNNVLFILTSFRTGENEKGKRNDAMWSSDRNKRGTMQ